MMLDFIVRSSLGAAFVGAAAVVVLTTGLIWAVSVESQTFLGLGAALLLLCFALILPIHVLPSAALVVYALVPAKLLPDAEIVSVLPLGTVLLLVWLLRRWSRTALSKQRRGMYDQWGRVPWVRAGAVTALAFVLWAIVSAITHSSQLFGLGWLLSFATGVFAAFGVRDAHREAALLSRTFMIIGGLSGSYAVVEMFLGSSPVFGTLYSAFGAESSQHWSVYRAEVSFSHPLFAGTFLAAAAALGIITWFDSGSRAALTWGVLATAGVVATLSRGPMIAFVAATAFGLVAISTAGRMRRPGRVLFIGAAAAVSVFAVSNIEAFNERNDSVEANRSAEARNTGLDVALQAAASSNYMGTGPATSGQTGSLFGSVIIENSYLQVLISLGIPGLALLMAFLISTCWLAVRKRRFAPAAALVAASVALAGFNGLDAVRAMHLVLGLCVFIAVHESSTVATGSKAVSSITQHRFRFPAPHGPQTGRLNTSKP